MKSGAKPARRARAAAEAQLDAFIAKFEPPRQTLIRAVRKALRKRLPRANELVYDNYNFFGSGKQTRFIRLESADMRARPEVAALMAAAVAREADRSRREVPRAGSGGADAGE